VAVGSNVRLSDGFFLQAAEKNGWGDRFFLRAAGKNGC